MEREIRLWVVRLQLRVRKVLITKIPIGSLPRILLYWTEKQLDRFRWRKYKSIRREWVFKLQTSLLDMAHDEKNIDTWKHDYFEKMAYRLDRFRYRA